jgi:hypothetical protein
MKSKTETGSFGHTKEKNIHASPSAGSTKITAYKFRNRYAKVQIAE